MEIFNDLFTDEEKVLLKQYGDYMKSAGFYSVGADVNCWRFKYGENPKDSFWVVDLYSGDKFSPRIYQFKWKFDGIHDPTLITINEGIHNVCYKPKDFDEFKKRIDETVSKFGEYKKYKKQLIENKRLQKIQADF